MFNLLLGMDGEIGPIGFRGFDGIKGLRGENGTTIIGKDGDKGIFFKDMLNK